MAPLVEVAPGLWQLTAPRRGRPSTKTGYVLRDGEDTILVDPVISSEPEAGLAALDEVACGNVRILVTTPFHVRDSTRLWRRWQGQRQVTIYGHPRCAARLEDLSDFQPVQGGETLEGGVRAHSLGQRRNAEIPFELPAHRALAVGDRLLEIDGELRFWPPRLSDGARDRAWYENEFLPAMHALARLPVDRVLVTHGRPVLEDGAGALTRSLEQPPWRR
jgi:glyoxylase-like metal-dependent hydrolase (beta-lactamase superfamily II)